MKSSLSVDVEGEGEKMTGLENTALVFMLFQLLVTIFFIWRPFSWVISACWAVFGLFFAGLAVTDTTLPFTPYSAILMGFMSVMLILRAVQVKNKPY